MKRVITRNNLNQVRPITERVLVALLSASVLLSGFPLGAVAQQPQRRSGQEATGSAGSDISRRGQGLPHGGGQDRGSSLPPSERAKGSLIGGGGLTDSQFNQVLHQDPIDEINLSKLNEAKNLTTHIDTLHGIMAIEAEWRNLLANRQKRVATRNMVSAALSAAAEGRFDAAGFILNNVTDSVVKQDQEVVSAGLEQQYQFAYLSLSEIMARETVRSGQQAGLSYFVQVARQITDIEAVGGGGIFGKKTSYKNVTTSDSQTKFVWLPELVASYPIFDDANAQKFGKAKRTQLKLEDLVSEALAMTEPYSKVESGYFGLHDYLVPGVANAGGRLFCSIFYPCDFNECIRQLASNDPMRIYFKAWYDVNGRAMIREKSFAKFNTIEYRPLIERDRQVWAGALFEKASVVRSLLEQMWEKSERGYRFRAHSAMYNQFRSRIAAYNAALEQINNNPNVKFLSAEQLKNLNLNYPELAGNRPQNLEAAVEVALIAAQASGEEAVAKLIRESVTFGVDTIAQLSLEAEQIATLKDANGQAIIQQFRSMNSQDLRDDLVELFMRGEEETVRNIFNRLSAYIQGKFADSKNLLDQSRNAILAVEGQLVAAEDPNQIKLLEEARAKVEAAFATALKPDYIVTIEQVETVLRQEMTEKKIKQIYKGRDSVEFLQQGIRVAMGNGRDIARQVFDGYKRYPSQQVREALIGFHIYYAGKMATLQSENWPYLYYPEKGEIAKDAQGKEMWSQPDPSKPPVPVYVVKPELKQLPIFTQEQYKAYSIAPTITITEIEKVFANHYFDALNDAMDLYANHLGNVYRDFDAYPSLTIATALTAHLENFNQIRTKLRDDIAKHRIDDKTEVPQQIQLVRDRYTRSIDAIVWVDEDSAGGRNEVELIQVVKAAKPRYDDLLQ